MAMMIHRVSPAMRSSFARRLLLHASSLPTASPKDALLAKLLHENDGSGLQLALDSEEDHLSQHHGDASFWDPLLSALRSSSPAKAQVVLEWKLKKLLQQDIRQQGHYSMLILLGAQYGSIQFSEKVFLSMETHGIKPTTLVFNALISACFSTGNVVLSLSLFEIMETSQDCKPDAATYDAFISWYSQKGDTKMMLDWYSSKVAAGFVSEIQSYESLIAGLTKCCNFEEADRLYEEMISSGITVSVSLLECKLEGLCRRKKLNEIKGFLKFLLGGGWKMNEAMARKLVHLYLDLGLVEEMEELLLSVEKLSTLDVISLVHHGVIILYALEDRLNDMEFAIGRMLAKGILFTHIEDIEAIICCYFRKNAYTRLGLFLEQISEKQRLARSTYDLLVAGYKRAGLQEQFTALVKEMQKHGFC